MTPIQQRILDAEHPWPFLSAYGEADKNFFGGRETEANALYSTIRRDRVTVLYGVSGLGKTSLLGAGVFPLLREGGYFPVLIRLDFNDSAPPLAEQVKHEILEQGQQHDIEIPACCADQSLWQFLHHTKAQFWGPRNELLTPVLTFDQFEEIFTKGAATPKTVEPFLNELTDLMTGTPCSELQKRIDHEEEGAEERLYRYRDHRYRIIFALREDFLPQLDVLSKRLYSTFNNSLRLRPMSGTAALRSSVRAGGYLLDEDTAQRVIRVVAGQRDPLEIAATPETGSAAEPVPLGKLVVEPALLSIFFSELNERRLEDPAHSSKIEPGPLSAHSRDEILMKFYDRCLQGLGESVRDFIESELISSDGATRDTISVDRAVSEAGITRETIDTLVERRLLRIEESHSARRVELSHDVLLSVVNASRTQRKRERDIARATAAAEEARRSRQIEFENALAAAEQAAAQERTARRRARNGLLLAGTFLLISIYAVVRPKLITAEERKKEASAAVQVAMQSLDVGQAERSLAFLAHAVHLDAQNSAARGMLADLVLNRVWPVEVARVPTNEESSIDISSDGIHVLRTTGNRIDVTDLAGRPSFPPMTLGANVAARFNSAGNAVLLSMRDGGFVGAYDTQDGHPIIRDSRLQETESQPYDLTADGKTLIVSHAHGSRLTAYQVASGTLRSTPFESSRGPHSTRGHVISLQNSALFAREALLTDLGHGAQPLHLRGFSGIRFVRFTRNGLYVVICDRDNTLHVFSTADGRLVIKATDYEGRAATADLDPGGKRLVVVTASLNTAHIIDLTNTFADTVSLPHRARVVTATFSSDGQLILTTSADGMVRCWDAATGAPVGESMPHGRPVTRALFGANNNEIVTLDAASTLRRWRIPPSRNWPLPVDDDLIAFNVSAKSGIVLAEVADGVTAVDLRTHGVLGRQPRAGTGVWDSNRTSGRVLLEPEDGKIVTWMPRSGQVIALVSHAQSVLAGALSGDGTVAAVQWKKRDGRETTIGVFNALNGSRLGTIAAPDNKISLALDMRGDRVAVLAGDTLRFYDRNGAESSARAIGISGRHDTDEQPFSFDETADRLLTFSRMDGARLWTTEDGKALTDAFETKGNVSFAILSNDGERLVTIGDKRVSVWNVAERSVAGRLEAGEEYKSALFLDKNTVLLIGPDTARVWDTAATMAGPSFKCTLPPEPTGDGRVLAVIGRVVSEIDVRPVKDTELKDFQQLAEGIAGAHVDDYSILTPLQRDKQVQVVNEIVTRCKQQSSRVCRVASTFGAALPQ